jgi:uncharacterized membrane protein
VLNDLIASFTLNTNALENSPSAVQFGFIAGTLLFAVFTNTNRFSPSKVIFACTLPRALYNACLIFECIPFLLFGIGPVLGLISLSQNFKKNYN